MTLVRVSRICAEAQDIISLELCSIDGTPLPPFAAGAHIDVHIRPDLVRQYSLCNHPAETHRYRLAVKREPQSRGGSKALHEELGVGDILEVGLPRNNFPLHATAQHHVLMAGGIGVTPLLSMALDLHGRGASFELHYFTRSADHTAFRQYLSVCEFRNRVAHHVGTLPSEVPGKVRSILAGAASDTHVYICGPQPFMETAKGLAVKLLSGDAVHLEYFGANKAHDPKGNGAFEVRLARSGITVTVLSDQSIVDALARQGVMVETLCQQGVCATCLTTVLAGEPDHRDTMLSDEERRTKMLICVSRCRGELLVLDL